MLLPLLTALALLAAERPAEARNTCPQPRGYTQVAVSGEARVFERGEYSYGCHVSTRRVVLLGIEAFGYRLAGKFVARWWVFCCEAAETEEYTIVVSDLRTGDRPRVSSVWAKEDDTPAIPNEFLATRAGALAWIACVIPANEYRCERGSASHYRLWRFDRRGMKLLDETTGIALRALRRDGSSLTWRHGDELRSATIK